MRVCLEVDSDEYNYEDYGDYNYIEGNDYYEDYYEPGSGICKFFSLKLYYQLVTWAYLSSLAAQWNW